MATQKPVVKILKDVHAPCVANVRLERQANFRKDLWQWAQAERAASVTVAHTVLLESQEINTVRMHWHMVISVTPVDARRPSIWKDGVANNLCGVHLEHLNMQKCIQR